jgi:hypothetical protein
MSTQELINRKLVHQRELVRLRQCRREWEASGLHMSRWHMQVMRCLGEVRDTRISLRAHRQVEERFAREVWGMALTMWGWV